MGPSGSRDFTAADMWDEIKKVDTSPPSVRRSKHPTCSVLTDMERLLATARRVRARRRWQCGEGGVEGRVVIGRGGGGVDDRACGGDAGGVLLAGLGVPRHQVPRRKHVPQVSCAAHLR